MGYGVDIQRHIRNLWTGYSICTGKFMATAADDGDDDDDGPTPATTPAGASVALQQRAMRII